MKSEKRSDVRSSRYRIAPDPMALAAWDEPARVELRVLEALR
jgi:hypothetical protein